MWRQKTLTNLKSKEIKKKRGANCPQKKSKSIFIHDGDEKISNSHICEIVESFS